MNEDGILLEIDELFSAGIIVWLTLPETSNSYATEKMYVYLDQNRIGMLVQEPGEGNQPIVFIPWHRIHSVEFARKDDAR